MLTRIKKWGNSQGIMLPKALLDAIDMPCGTEVEICIENNRLVIQTVLPKKEHYDLEDLFKNYQGDYQPREESWGPPRGREAW